MPLFVLIFTIKRELLYRCELSIHTVYFSLFPPKFDAYCKSFMTISRG